MEPGGREDEVLRLKRRRMMMMKRVGRMKKKKMRGMEYEEDIEERCGRFERCIERLCEYLIETRLLCFEECFFFI